MTYMTRKIALTKECPFPLRGLCAVDRCMAWRWTDPVRRFHVNVDPMAHVEPQRTSLTPDSWLWSPHDGEEPAGWLEPQAAWIERRTGSCSMCTNAREA